MEYLPLRNVLRQDPPVTKEETVILLEQCLQALEFLHGPPFGPAHRDTKPENIPVESRKPLTVKLADFGLAREHHNMATQCGTPFYQAPEIDTSKYDKAVDIWSLGVIFQMIYGLPTWENEGWCETIVKSLEEQRQKLGGPLLDLLFEMLKIDPHFRPSATQCLSRQRSLAFSDMRRKNRNSNLIQTQINCPLSSLMLPRLLTKFES